MDYTSVKEKLLQSWRYNTSAVIKRHKSHLSLSFSRVYKVPSTATFLTAVVKIGNLIVS